jgi:hypothetical protein
MLGGRIDAPAFNLRNELMVAKHVHATVITRLHQYTRDNTRSESERRSIEATLRATLPDRVSTYLFEEGQVREQDFDLSSLKNLIDRDLEDLVAYVELAFCQGWPKADVFRHGIRTPFSG